MECRSFARISDDLLRRLTSCLLIPLIVISTVPSSASPVLQQQGPRSGGGPNTSENKTAARSHNTGTAHPLEATLPHRKRMADTINGEDSFSLSDCRDPANSKGATETTSFISGRAQDRWGIISIAQPKIWSYERVT